MFTFTPVAWTFYFCFLLDFKKIDSNTIFQRALGYKLNLDAKSQKPNVKRRQMYVHFPH